MTKTGTLSSPPPRRALRDLLEGQGAATLTAYGALLLCFVGVLDLLTGPDLSFYVFYFFPILLMTGLAGLPAGIALSLVAVGIWYLADRLSGAPSASDYVQYWNTAVRLGSFLLIATMQFLLGRERHHARTDYLTRLANRQYFNEVAEKEMGRSRRYRMPFTVAYIDLDNFKKVNDRHGHMTGNRLLRTVAATLRENIRDVDTAARLGGDEFAVLLPQTDGAAGKEALLKLQTLLNETMHANRWPVTFSIGAVTFIEPPGSIRDLLSAVDKRMYNVKNSGKDGIQFDVQE